MRYPQVFFVRRVAHVERAKTGCGWPRSRFWTWETRQLIERVSIHAPMWGATMGVDMPDASHIVSIHAPMWGATAMQLPGAVYRIRFQSTRPCGARHYGARPIAVKHSVFQSTRPCGARPSGRPFHWRIYGSFNPRAHVGRDLSFAINEGPREAFQSTRPCGARPLSTVCATSAVVFQSTRPCGARRDREPVR